MLFQLKISRTKVNLEFSRLFVELLKVCTAQYTIHYCLVIQSFMIIEPAETRTKMTYMHHVNAVFEIHYYDLHKRSHSLTYMYIHDCIFCTMNLYFKTDYAVFLIASQCI